MQKQVLIVDDSRVARMSLKKVLLAHDVEITEADSAEEAINYLQTAAHSPDIIFMDVMMEGMDGLAATKQIKENPKLNKIPVVICTGNQSELDKEKAFAAGAMSVLTKPPESHLVADIFATLKQQAVEVPKRQSVVVKVDKATMTAKVIEIIEQKLLPKLTQQAEQIAFEAVKKANTDNQIHLKSEINNASQVLKEQLLIGITRDSLATIQPILEQQINDSVTENARQAMQTMTDNVDLSKPAAEALAHQAQTWLAKQERELQVELGMQIGPKVITAVDQHLDKSLAAMIAPLVMLQVEKQLTNQHITADIDIHDKDEKYLQMTKRVNQLNTVVVGLALSVLILAIFVLI